MAADKQDANPKQIGKDPSCNDLAECKAFAQRTRAEMVETEARQTSGNDGSVATHSLSTAINPSKGYVSMASASSNSTEPMSKTDKEINSIKERLDLDEEAIRANTSDINQLKEANRNFQEKLSRALDMLEASNEKAESVQKWNEKSTEIARELLEHPLKDFLTKFFDMTTCQLRCGGKDAELEELTKHFQKSVQLANEMIRRLDKLERESVSATASAFATGAPALEVVAASGEPNYEVVLLVCKITEASNEFVNFARESMPSSRGTDTIIKCEEIANRLKNLLQRFSDASLHCDSSMVASIINEKSAESIELLQLREKVAALTSRNEQLTGQVNNASTSAMVSPMPPQDYSNDLRRHIATLEQFKDSLYRENADLKVKEQMLILQLASKNEEISSLQGENRNLQTSVDASVPRSQHDLVSQHSTDNIQRLAGENTDLRSENTSLKSENDNFRSQIAGLTSENAASRRANTELRSENTNLRRENTTLRRSLDHSLAHENISALLREVESISRMIHTDY